MAGPSLVTYRRSWRRPSRLRSRLLCLGRSDSRTALAAHAGVETPDISEELLEEACLGAGRGSRPCNHGDWKRLFRPESLDRLKDASIIEAQLDHVLIQNHLGAANLRSCQFADVEPGILVESPFRRW